MSRIAKKMIIGILAVGVAIIGAIIYHKNNMYY